jgi:hypothetical protein
MPSSSYNLNLNKYAVEDPLGPNFLGTLYRDSFEQARTIHRHHQSRHQRHPKALTRPAPISYVTAAALATTLT